VRGGDLLCEAETFVRDEISSEKLFSSGKLVEEAPN
jgi:hypothetical protein